MSICDTEIIDFPDFFKKIIQKNETLANDLIEQTSTNQCVILSDCNVDIILKIFENLNKRKDNPELTEFSKKSIYYLETKLTEVYISMSCFYYFNKHEIKIHYRNRLEESDVFLLEVNDRFDNNRSYIAAHGRFGGHYACKHGSRFVVI